MKLRRLKVEPQGAKPLTLKRSPAWRVPGSLGLKEGPPGLRTQTSKESTLASCAGGSEEGA